MARSGEKETESKGKGYFGMSWAQRNPKSSSRTEGEPNAERRIARSPDHRPKTHRGSHDTRHERGYRYGFSGIASVKYFPRSS